jgi:hypothetical protein
MALPYAHELKAGDRYQSLEFSVSPEFNQQFLFAVEDYNPIYIEGHQGGPPVVHPAVLMYYSPRTRSPSFRQAPDMGSAMAQDSAVYHGAAYVDTPLRIDWLILNTYEKRGKIYQDYIARVLEARTERLILERTMASTFFSLGKVKTFALGPQT